jgi:antitoxin PrlF
MSAATVSSKGQITLPKSARKRLGVLAGGRVAFVEMESGLLIVPAKRHIRSLRGMVPKPAKPVSLEDMAAAIRKMGRIS